jgi:hypothetical protein
MSEPTREQAVRHALIRVLCNAGNYPQEFAHEVLGRDLTKLVDNAHEAVMKAVVESDEYEYNLVRIHDGKERYAWDSWIEEELAYHLLEAAKLLNLESVRLVKRRKAGKVENVD